jgi:hypothetical protein
MDERYEEKCGFIEYNGKNLFYIEFSEDVELNRQVIKHCQSIISQHELKSLLIMTYVKNANYDRDLINELKSFTKNNEPYVKASAIIGIDGFKKAILLAVQKFTNRNFELFDDIDQAKQWLVSQE